MAGEVFPITPNSDSLHRSVQDPLLWAGLRSPVALSRLPALPADFSVERVLARYRAWPGRPAALWRPLIAAYGASFALAAALKLLQDCLRFAIPQVLKLLIRAVRGENTCGFLLAAAIFCLGAGQTILLQVTVICFISFKPELPFLFDFGQVNANIDILDLLTKLAMLYNICLLT